MTVPRDVALLRFIVYSPSNETFRLEARSPRQAASMAAREASLPCEMAPPTYRDADRERWRVGHGAENRRHVGKTEDRLAGGGGRKL